MPRFSSLPVASSHVDMTALPELEKRFVVVPRRRGQQLKDQAQLDGWLRDGSAEFVNQLCVWET